MGNTYHHGRTVKNTENWELEYMHCDIDDRESGHE